MIAVMTRPSGKFIVIEGADATGKQTQVRLLEKYLISENLGVRVLDFPRYYDNFWGKMVGAYLRGKFGELYENNPYLSTLPYILDQSDTRYKIRYSLRKGDFVLSNRYVSSNIHQGSKLPYYERDEYLRWLEEAAYGKLKAVVPDITVILHIPAEKSEKLNKERTDRAYLNGKSADIAETDADHQEEARKEFQRLANTKKTWKLVNCMKEDENLKTPEEIHLEILDMLESNGIFSNIVPKDQLNLVE